MKETLTAAALRLRARTLSVRFALTAAGEAPAEQPAPITQDDRAKDGFNDSRLNFKKQYRDQRGKFRKVLARLRQDLGESGLQRVTDKLQQVEQLDFAGNYTAANRAAGALLSMVDRIDTGALNSRSLENVRASAAELGRVIANTPLPFGDPNSKLSFSDLPPSMKDLAESMAERVESKLGPKDGTQATKKIRGFMSGSDQLSQSEVQSEYSTLLRLLT